MHAFLQLDGFWTPVIFLMVGLVLLLVEVLNPGFFIAVPGGTLVLMGTIGLLVPDSMFGPLGWFLWPLAATVSIVANLFAYRKWAPADKAPITMGLDSLPGQTGVVEEAVSPGHVGLVRIRGAAWSARSDDALEVGTKVRVRAVEGVHVVVERDAT